MFMAVNVSPVTTERPELLALLAGCDVDEIDVAGLVPEAIGVLLPAHAAEHAKAAVEQHLRRAPADAGRGPRDDDGLHDWLLPSLRARMARSAIQDAIKSVRWIARHFARSHAGIASEGEVHALYSAWPSMIGPNSCHFSPVNFIIWTCSIG